ncbi:MAG: sodium/glutamate symporter [Rothia sp. (in: high G+C Gram-positive bacteria)]|uniref:sodium/glutamate symporter n=1 Tax=Rothia sp. (in: high G+C Gram-positive bacteria) TaxID=1885016 RepID=UPI0026F67607|nr:sodium/glutamate symporter [Rothia sp. (in: high G+C Gram-positive bacteria)]
MTLELTMVQSAGWAVMLLLLGMWIKNRFYFFQRFAIPSPVIGGFLFSLVNLVLNQTGVLTVKFDTTLQSFFMVIFFTSVGYGASLKVLKSAGSKVGLFLLVATGLCIAQNIVAVLLAPVVNVDPALALMTGSTPMTGGHGVSGGIAPLVEASGVTGAETVAYTAATFGLIAGSLMGGPLANRLIVKHNLLEKESSHQVNINTALLTVRPRKLDADSILHGFIMILVAMFIGSYLTEALNYLVGQLTDRAAFPSYMGPMFIAITLRYISDRRNSKEYHELVPEQEVEVLGNIGLNVFLAMALMNVQLWQLAELAIPLIVLLLAQVALMWVWANFVTFRVMGKDYDAAILTAGHCGFGMGATPNGIANMASLVTKYKASKLAFFILPIVGGMFIDFTNLVNIMTFLSIA